MADVRPLPGRTRLVAPPPPRGTRKPLPRPPGRTTTPGLGCDDPDGSSLVSLERAGDGFAFAAPGLDRRALRELERGSRPPEATLDLHGRRTAEAGAALEAFVRGAQSGGRRVLLIVHGRGLGSGEAGPVLRQLVHERLTSGALARAVLAVVAAPPRLGGSGAALVWLRRSG
jgi:DNA-nicking Smr family endonuclease